jgi:hypothetical protein
LYAHFVVLALHTKPSGRPYGGQLSFLEERSGGMPIVVTEGLEFSPLWYYAPAALRARLFYVSDLAYAQRIADSTNEEIVLRLAPMWPDSIVGFSDFVNLHKTFLLYYVGESANSSLDELLSHKCTVSLESKEGQQLLFRCGCG